MTNYTLTAAKGTFTLTGVGAGLLRSAILNAPCGVFTLTGNDASAHTYQLPVVTDGPKLAERISLGQAIALTSGSTVGGTFTPAYAIGAAINAAITLNAAPGTQQIASQLLADQANLSAALMAATTVTLSSAVTIAPTVSFALAIAVAQGLFLSDQTTPTLHFNASVVEALNTNAAFANFLGESAASAVTLSASISPLWQPAVAVNDHVTLSATAGGSLLVRIALADGAHFADSEILNAILTGTISEGVEITAGYVSPSGGFTAWAINTRTTAVTEYQNFNFDSLVQWGRVCLAADATGLYELDGETDAGAPIIADILSGIMQVGGSRLAALKCAYLGLGSKSGSFVLKVITGDGRTYVYGLTARDMRTTRVNFGKGLRSRYFRFELQNIDGADFDMNNIEFVPLVAQRRI
jgi:hypothetical protein